MSLTYEQAADEILAKFKSAWDTTGLPAHYEDVARERSESPDGWAVALIQHSAGFKTTLSDHEGARRFTRLGFLTVRIYTPSGTGLHESRALAKVVADAFEGRSTPGGVWFSGVIPNERGRDGAFYQTDVIVDFHYDEIK